MIIHREGYKILIILFFILVIISVVWLYSFKENIWLCVFEIAVSISFYMFILQFFRNPKVNTSINSKHVLSPADGKVVVIEQVEENEYFNNLRKQISIFMSPLNVHVNRNPISGKVEYLKYHKGKYLVAWHPKSSIENERNTVVIRNENNVDILFRQIAGTVARRIKCYLKLQQIVIQGDEMGFIKFGSRVDIFLPLDSHINVNLKEKVRAGKTVIATLL